MQETLDRLTHAAEVLSTPICKTSSWDNQQRNGKVSLARDVLTPQDRVADAAMVWARVDDLEDPTMQLALIMWAFPQRRPFLIPQLEKLAPNPRAGICIANWFGVKRTSLKQSAEYRGVSYRQAIKLRAETATWLQDVFERAVALVGS